MTCKCELVHYEYADSIPTKKEAKYHSNTSKYG